VGCCEVAEHARTRHAARLKQPHPGPHAIRRQNGRKIAIFFKVIFFNDGFGVQIATLWCLLANKSKYMQQYSTHALALALARWGAEHTQCGCMRTHLSFVSK
jgi:hypothetical protein